LRRVRVA